MELNVEYDNERAFESVNLMSVRFQMFEKQDAHIYQTNAIPFARFAYIVDGNASFYVNDRLALKAGRKDVIYVPPNTAYTSHWPEKSHIFVIDIFVNDPVLSVHDYGDEIRTLFNDRNDTLEESLCRLSECRREREPYTWMERVSIVLKMLCDIFRLQSEEVVQQSRIYQSLIYMRYNFNKEISTAELARMCSFSESQFRRLFKEKVHMSPVEYRNVLRVRCAEDLIHNQHYTVAEAAEKVGFSDVNYFTRMYKKYHGITPGQTRHEYCELEPQL